LMESLKNERNVELEGLISGVNIEEENESQMTKLYKRLFSAGGCFISIALLPLAFCGGGPVVQITEGSQAIVLKYGNIVRVFRLVKKFR
jgi:hypothetical protein